MEEEGRLAVDFQASGLGDEWLVVPSIEMRKAGRGPGLGVQRMLGIQPWA